MKENQLIPPQARRPAAYRVIKETLLKYDITPDEFFSAKLSRRRGIKDLVAATREICARLRYEHNYSTTLIGKCINRDHSSVIYHLRMYNQEHPEAMEAPDAYCHKEPDQGI